MRTTIPIGHIAASARLSEVGLHNGELSSYRDSAANHLVLTLRASVLVEHQKPYSYETPASWWQHFKRDVLHVDRWLSRLPAGWRRFVKVRMTTTTISLKTIYPTLRTKLPADLVGPYVTVHIADRPLATFLSDVDGGVTLDEYDREVVQATVRQAWVSDDKCPCCKRSWREH